jgi:hypothetical protein
MANTLNISITAADRATRVIQNLNKRVDQMTRPFQNVQRSLQRFGRAAGFDTVKRKLEGLTQTARGVVSAFARIGAPLLALIGGGTIAGLLALTDGWARFGLQLAQTAQILGVNTQDLYNFQNAARLVGISGQGATQAFSSFADTLQDARWGRNQQAMALLVGLHMQLNYTKAGAIDTMDMLGQVADKIHGFQQAGNTGAARTLARQLGVTELLPFLMLGRKAMEAYETQAAELAGKMDWKQAAAAALLWNRLDVSMTGTKNAISQALLPAITPLVEQFGAWITANRGVIATDIGDFVRGLGAAFKGLTLKDVLDDILSIVKGILDLGKGISTVVSALGGVKGVLIDLAVLWAVPKFLAINMAFVKVATGIDIARKALLAYRAASLEAAGGETVATVAAKAGTVGLRVASMASAAVPAVAAGLIANQLWDGKIGDVDFNSWSGLANSMKSDKAQQKVMGFFQRQGWTHEQAAGIAANIQAESNFNPHAVGDHGQARGIGQWHPDRQAAFNTWAVKNKLPVLEHAGLMEQLQYYEYELRHSGAGKKLSDASTAAQSGSIVSLYDERPAGGQAEAAHRGALATQLSGIQVTPLNVSVQTTVQRDGTTTTRVQTPAGVKIVHTNPADSVS